MRRSGAGGSKRAAVDILEDDPLWYKDAIVYQAHVRSFADGNADGIGDFRGLAEKLDYLRDLGVTAIWLLPFYPSPLKDDGYDIADYTSIHPHYGTLADFRAFLREAHRRGLRVITELVINHTSDQHPWFQRARRAPAGSRERDFYVWSDTTDKYREARIIFKDFEMSNWSWDPVAGAYYWHRFYSHQPDLNFDNPAVMKAVLQFLNFWLAMGVDGMRLDAVPYLHERDGSSCENLAETHQVLKKLRRGVDAKFRSRMLLAEANQWPEDVLPYFGEEDECHMAFHFPLMPRMFMAVRMEDRYPLIDILSQTPEIPESCQWAVFLRNHDELTLEMVTDEERDYMYRVYANDTRARINLGIRRRLAPLLENNRRRIELMNGLLFAMPGTPVIYYGDEIGMGDNIYLGDRNGVRTPMQWSSDRNAGFSRANSQRLFLPVIIDPEFHYEALNVEAQQNNPSSLLWWTRRLIALRKRFKAFGRGRLEFLYPENRKILAFVRSWGDETILVVANLSRFSQYAELDLAEYKERVPVELFGNTRFPPIGELPYLVTLGAHAFYWFSLEPVKSETALTAPRTISLEVKGGWKSVFDKVNSQPFEKAMSRYLPTRRWFGAKAQTIDAVSVQDAVAIGAESLRACMVILLVEYRDRDADRYLMPLRFASGEEARDFEEGSPQEIIARVACKDGKGVLVDALSSGAFRAELLETIARRRKHKGFSGEVRGSATRAHRKLRGPAGAPLESSLIKAEQSNSSIIYADRMVMKLFRRLDEGVNPDLEIGRFLTESAHFTHTPDVAGALEYHRREAEPTTLAILQGFVRNQGDAWKYTQDTVARFFERVVSRSEPDASTLSGKSALEDSRRPIPSAVREIVGIYIESARLLGLRTAEMHLALASDDASPAFAAEPFTPFYQRSLYQSMRNLRDQVLELLRKQTRTLSEPARREARDLLGLKAEILERFGEIRREKIAAQRIRIHGDYHLGQVLYTGKDFVIIDYEGEPAYSLSARRIKRTPLRDVAGMLRSFDYAAHAALAAQARSGIVNPETMAGAERWAEFWVHWVSAAYLRAYLKKAATGSFLPRAHDERAALLQASLLEKALYELGYELNNRPDWVQLPLRGVLRLLRTPA